MKTKSTPGNESQKVPHTKRAREACEEAILANRRKENPRAGWKEAFLRARLRRVKEDLWNGIPLNEGWDN